MSVVYGKYTTYDSQYLSDEIKGLAMLVEPRLTTSWDLFPEGKPGNELSDNMDKSSTVVNWYDAVREELNGAVRTGWNNSDTTGLKIDDALALLVNVGDILKIEDEWVVVSSVTSRATNNATISVHARGHGASSAAAHNDLVPILIVGNAQVEGSVSLDAISGDTIKRTNYYSLVEEQLSVTKTAQNQAFEDIQDIVEFQRQVCMNRALKKINLSVIYGLKEAGTKTTPRSAGGMEEFLNSATYDASRVNCGGAFTELKLQAILKEIALRGGMPNVVLMSPKNKQIANGFNNSYINTDRKDRQAGSIIDTYQDQNAGEVTFVSDMSMRDDVIFVLNTNKIGKKWFSNDMLRFVPETNVSSRQYVETLQGQYTVWFKDIAFEHGALYGIV